MKAAGTSTVPLRRIGARELFPIAFGPMRLSYAGRPPESAACDTIRAALDGGVTLLDSADVYCETPGTTGHNERLIRSALAGWHGERADVLVATKGGHVREPDGSISRDGRPESLRAACDASLRALGVERIELYYHHSPDPRVPLEESLGAIKDLRDAGKIAQVGVSNYSVEQVQLARSLVDVVAVQNRLSYRDRSSVGVVDLCHSAGLAFVAWGVLGRSSTAIAPNSGVHAVAAAHGVSPQQVALAWALALSPCVIPIAGARTPANLADCLAAAELALSGSELALIDGDAAPAE